MLISSTAAAACLNGGYASLTTAGGTQPLPSEAACVLYVGQGGMPVPVSTTLFTVTGGPGVTGAYCMLTFTGAGLLPGSQPTFQFGGTANTGLALESGSTAREPVVVLDAVVFAEAGAVFDWLPPRAVIPVPLDGAL
jgi:hypothetical protein